MANNTLSITSPPGLVSLVIPCCGMLEYTRICVPSVLRHSREPFELIFLDIGSLDGTAEYLAGLRDGLVSRLRVEICRAATDLDISAACKEALAKARGEFVCLLNNDTVVTPKWLAALTALAKMSDGIGLVGPMSNYAAPPQLVETVPYRLGPKKGARPGEALVDMDAVQSFARDFAGTNRGKWVESERLGGFCLLIRRAVLDRVGPGLNEWTDLSLFDSDILSAKARQAGFTLACCRDLFIHHFGTRTLPTAHRRRSRPTRTATAASGIERSVWSPGFSRKRPAKAGTPTRRPLVTAITLLGETSMSLYDPLGPVTGGPDPELMAALAERPCDAALLNARGVLALAPAPQRAADLVAAANAFQDAWSADPRHVVAGLNLAHALVALGQREPAAHQARRVLAVLDSAVPCSENHQNCGDVSRNSGEFRYDPAFLTDSLAPYGCELLRVEWERAVRSMPNRRARAARRSNCCAGGCTRYSASSPATWPISIRRACCGRICRRRERHLGWRWRGTGGWPRRCRTWRKRCEVTPTTW